MDAAALRAHDIVVVQDGPYAGLTGSVDTDGRIRCHGFEPFTASVERAKPAPFHTRGFDATIGERIAVELELAKACRGLRHVVADEDQHGERAVCMSCGEQLDLGV